MHPDKICDRIADALLDEYLTRDSKSRVAVEVMGGHGQISISGEVTSRAEFDVDEVVREIVGDGFKINKYLSKQSEFIAQGVDIGGAGDQGIMNGYATREADNFMPLEYELARDLCRKVYEKYPFDGKTQVTVEDGKPKVVVVSFQNSKTEELMKLVKSHILADEYLINPAGEWSVGGFDADSGLSGRKIVVDNYGPKYAVGGGSFSGKDYTKVDRSGAYMARKVAVDYLKKYDAKFVTVRLAYAIGKRDPVMAVAEVDGREVLISGYDLSPRGIRESLELNKVVWSETSSWGHFGRGFAWDQY